MASEAKRGCGYRKVGGLYLVGPKLSGGCGKLPVELHVCPTCTSGIKQTRGWIWVAAKPIFEAQECREQGVLTSAMVANGSVTHMRDRGCDACPLGGGIDLLGDKCGLLWVGGKFYPEPEDWMKEANTLGVSRRIAALPRGFKLGEHWVLIAHPRAIKRRPQTPEEQAELVDANKARVQDDLPLEAFLVRKGIISVFQPTAIEKIVTESQAKETAEMDALRKKGITPVVVPDEDKDHQGNVFDVDDGEDDDPQTT
jgi:hypothetical protein